STDPLLVLIRKTRPWPQRMARRGLRKSTQAYLASLVVWLVTLPLVMLHFQVASPATVLLSPLLMIPLALALISGLGAVVLDVIWPTAALGIGGVMSWLLTSMEWIVVQAHAVSFVPGQVPGPPVWWVAGFYAVVLGGGYWYLGRRCRLPKLVVAVTLWVAVGLGQSLAVDQWRDQRPELRCTFLAVGHGTSVLLELPEGRTILYDCGRLGSPRRASEIASATLLSRGIRHLDAVVLSHEDVDHYNGLPGLMERFSVGVVYASWPMLRDPSPLGERLSAEIERLGVPVKMVAASDRLDLPGGVEISVLHPAGRGVLGSDNANSIVLLIEYAGQRILLPGDLESPGLEWLLAEQPIPCDVVMAPHHGSQNSHPAAFYPWCQPKWVVVSSGSQEVEGLDAATLQGLETSPEVLNTAQDGAVEVVLRADRPPRVTSFRERAGKADR
ncbi:MAG: ComEC/Rec2 family competence protein, partial [Pirellulaceae bacterium]